MRDQGALSRRDFLRGMALIGIGASLASCAPKSSKEPSVASEQPVAQKVTTQAPAPKEKITIRIQTPATVNTIGMVNKRIEEYMKEHPEIEVISEETVYMEISTKTETGFISGTLQDIPYGHNRWYFYGCYKGFYRPLDDYISASPPDDLEDFFPLVMEYNMFEGKQYSLPQYVHPSGTIVAIYNKQTLEEAGVSEPEEGWTWDDLAEKAAQCTNKDKGIWGWNYPGASAIHGLQPFLRSWGKPTLDDKSSWMLSEDGRTFDIHKPNVETPIKFLLEQLKSGVMPTAADQIEGGLFLAGRLAFDLVYVGGHQKAQKQNDGRFDVGWVLRPLGPEGREGLSFSGNQWMVYANSKHPNEAWDVIKALTEKEINTWAILEAELQPGRKSCWQDPRVVAAVPPFGVCAEKIQYLEPFPMPWNLRFVEANDVYMNESQSMWSLEKSWEEQGRVVQDKVQAIFDLDRPRK